MDKKEIKIDHEKMSIAMAKHVREKAIAARNLLYYVDNGYIISEDPRTGEKKIIKKSTR